jgi:predicted RNA methylase
MPRAKGEVSTFLAMVPAGTAALCADLLSVDGVVAEVIDDSMVRLRTRSASLSERANDFSTNIVRVVAESPRRSLPASIAILGEKILERPAGLKLSKKLGYRIMAHIDGQMQGIDAATRQDLQRSIETVTQAKLQSRGGGDEVWIVSRRDLDRVYLGVRQQLSSATRQEKGALSPQLAAILVAIAGVGKGSSVLDPFAGSGAIPLACAKAGASTVFASDSRLQRTATRATARYRSVKWSEDDVTTIAARLEHTVDIIVTDPPWGEFAKSTDMDSLLVEATRAIDVALKLRTGRCVILMSRRLAGTVGGLLESNSMRVVQRVPILVNGHPATILVANR